MIAAPPDAAYRRRDLGDPGPALVAAAVVFAGSVVVAAALALIVHHGVGYLRFDRRVLHLFRSHHRAPGILDVARALADLGTIQTLVVIAAIAAVALRARRVHPVLCAAPLVSLLLTGLLVEIAKLTIPRASPNTYRRLGSVGGGSFPSGHAADTTALAVGVAIVLGAVLLRRPAERVLVFGGAAAVSIAVGISRLVLGVHWPTDVLAGWAIGLGTAVLVATVSVLLTRDRPFVPAEAHADTVRS
jgi:undecaprenyl-diphosphatase